MRITSLNGRHFQDFILGGFDNLKANKEQIDALNVFPVPDGDTGTNMFLTMQSAVKKAEQINGITLANVAEALSTGSLMGARGNSGVILSQIFRGLAQGLSKYEEASAEQVAQALQGGVETAYKAVMKPVEGTILTVTKETARAAVNKAKTTDCVIEVLRDALIAGERALAFTPEQLPALKQAGVVDAGGKGFLVILEGGLKALAGESTVSIFQGGGPAFETAVQEEINLDYPYCTEFLISGNSIPQEILRDNLASMGDCLLVVGTGELVKIHIHTNRPGLVLESAMNYGQLHQISISNMLDQNKEVANKISSTEYVHKVEEPKNIGLVAVAAGEGLVELLKSMGVDVVVTGGQTMNPSTEDLLDAVKEVNANKVIILPNNSNIILAAKQAQELSEDKEVAVVPTKTFPQALAALLMYDSEQELEELVENMSENIANIKTGEITFAVRDSQYNDIEIKEGEILGLVDNKIACTGTNIQQVAEKILEEMITGDSELITIFYGEDISQEEAEQLSDNLTKIYPEMEIEVHSGGQSLYYYIIGVE